LTPLRFVAIMPLIASNHRVGVVGQWPGWGIMGEQVKLLIAYNIRAGQENTYRRFVLEELLPQAQELGLVPTDAWHTAYGNYPSRLVGFVADDLETIVAARKTDEWRALIDRLEGYTGNLSQRVIPFRGGFQW
jgi:hypothetical protein